MKILVTGGCKNGKSFYAQELMHSLGEAGNLFYVATMAPVDGEDDERILRHKQERLGYGFETLEQPRSIEEILPRLNENSAVLFDSTTALLANEMFVSGEEINSKAADEIIPALLTISRKVKHIAFVSDWIYSDANRFDPLTEQYRAALAKIDRALAKELAVVCEVSFGHTIFHKGEIA